MPQRPVAASGGDFGAENWIAVRLSCRGGMRNGCEGAAPKDLSYAGRGWVLPQLGMSLGTAWGGVLFDFGQVNLRDGYSSLCAPSGFARQITRYTTHV